MSVYQPKLVTQLDGSRFAGQNCTMASGATALDRHTLGKKLCTGAKMRAHSGDISGGTNLGNLDTAWRVGHAEDLDVRHRMAWNDFVAMISAGRGAVLQLYYGRLGTYRCTTTFSGNHAVYINQTGVMRTSTGANVAAGLMMDPLCKSAKWVPLTTLRSAAGYLRLASGAIVGLGYCYAGFTRKIGLTTGTTAPAPGSVPTVVLTKPPTPAEVDPMIPGGGLVRTSSHVMSLKKGQPLYRTPGGAIATRMSADAKVEYFGPTGSWRCVEVSTGAPYADRIVRPTLVYVPAAAGPITKK